MKMSCNYCRGSYVCRRFIICYLFGFFCKFNNVTLTIDTLYQISGKIRNMKRGARKTGRETLEYIIELDYVRTYRVVVFE